MKYNTIFMYDSYTCDMYNYDIKELKRRIFDITMKYRNFH